jgi:chromate transport protein ChrA
MFGLAQGVSKIESILPDPVYALLSGLNAATVGLIALAGLQLSTRTITDGLSRTVLIGAACAGLLYTALWYFPVLMITGALLAIVWDLWMKEGAARLRKHFNDNRKGRSVVPPPAQPSEEGVPAENSRNNIRMTDRDEKQAEEVQATSTEPDSLPAPPLSVTTKQGVVIILAFFVIFITLMVLRSTIRDPPVDLRLFTNLFLAGTILFGGGPVVIPLLREYVVEEGWVSSRDFLIGLAIIQAFPGPNFNCE